MPVGIISPAGILPIRQCVPILQKGHFRSTARRSFSVRKLVLPSGGPGSRERYNARASRRLRFAMKPKCPIFTKPEGRMCSRNLRMKLVPLGPDAVTEFECEKP